MKTTANQGAGVEPITQVQLVGSPPKSPLLRIPPICWFRAFFVQRKTRRITSALERYAFLVCTARWNRRQIRDNCRPIYNLIFGPKAPVWALLEAKKIERQAGNLC